MSHLEKLLTIQVQPMKKDMIPTSEDEGIFDFRTDYSFTSAIDFYFHMKRFVKNVNEMIVQFLIKWMTNINRFPIYALFETYKWNLTEDKVKLEKLGMKYKLYSFTEDRMYMKAIIKKPAHLSILYEVYQRGAWNAIAGWAFQDFHMDLKSEPGVIGPYQLLFLHTSSADFTFFHVTHDGHSVCCFSNEPRFSTVDSFLRYIPNNINIERWNEDGSPEE